MANALIHFDGSYGEGGGALVRAVLALASLTQQSCRIECIRGATAHPGLDQEDLSLLQTLQKVTSAKVTGGELGSSILEFSPTRPPSAFRGEVHVPIHAAARYPSTLSVLNALVPVLARSGAYSTITMAGETFGRRSLTYDYFEAITVPTLARLGLGVFPELEQAGYGREMEGAVRLEIEPSAFQPLHWATRGKLRGIQAMITYSNLPASVAERGCSHLKTLAQQIGLRLSARSREVPASGPGVFVTVWTEYESGMGGGTAMGARGVRIESLAQQAFDETAKWMSTNSTCDPYLADQILLPAVFAEGTSTFTVSELTKRLLTTIWVVKQFLPIHITVSGNEGASGQIQIRR